MGGLDVSPKVLGAPVGDTNRFLQDGGAPDKPEEPLKSRFVNLGGKDISRMFPRDL